MSTLESLFIKLSLFASAYHAPLLHWLKKSFKTHGKDYEYIYIYTQSASELA